MTATVERIREAQQMDVRELTYPGDEYLPAPIVYTHPQEPNLRFKVFHEELPIDADPRVWRPRRFVPEAFVQGKYVAHTRLQNEAVRRVLGQQANRWMGEDLAKDRVCHHDTCRFATRNSFAFDDHETFTDRHRPQPDFRPYT